MFLKIINLVNEIKLKKIVKEILYLENDFSKLSRNELVRIGDSTSDDKILINSFAIIREATYRTLGIKHYPNQLLGGIILSRNQIAEMYTGEGKTIVALLAAYYNYLKCKKVFIVTSNGYLAKRDKEKMEKVFNYLGVNVGLIYSGQTRTDKKLNYEKDIIYGSSTEFGFDYLRDLIVKDKDNILQVKKDCIIIDEIDSVLLDKGSQPLRLSKSSLGDTKFLIYITNYVKSLGNKDYYIDKQKGRVFLNTSGIDILEKKLGIKNLYSKENIELLYWVNQSLKANYIFCKDKDYIVKNNQVVLINKSTGRASKGVRLEGGLHQALEAKEGLIIKEQDKVIATSTYFNYIKKFNNISGMTGTAKTSENEFKYIYNLEVVKIPTNKSIKRIDLPDRLFDTKDNKFKQIIKDVLKINNIGQPILITTNYIYETEKISRELSKKNLKHVVLNAKQTNLEADIVAQAGKKGNITVSTNIAGRGTDIKLSEESKKIGGLYIIGTTRNKSRRVDNQIIGRSGRQGDPGITQIYISLEDELFINANDTFLNRFFKIISKLNKSDTGEYNYNKKVLQEIEKLQHIYESDRFLNKKINLKYEEIISIQAEIYQKQRFEILNTKDIEEFRDLIQKSLDMLYKNRVFDLEDELFNKVQILSTFSNRSVKDKNFYQEKTIFLKKIDNLWIDHLEYLDSLKKDLIFYKMGTRSKFNMNSSLSIFRQESFKNFETNLFNYYIEILNII